VSRSLLVALVGPDQQENLALEYLAAAVEHAGHRPAIIGFGGRDDIARTAHRVNSIGADAVGISIAFQSAVQQSLDLAAELRRVGFAGHITCGGHVPTFEYAAILAEAPAIDSVVRHDGEAALVELLGRIADGSDPSGVAGVVWRGPEGMRVEPARPPAPDLDQIAPPLRQPSPRVFAGLPIGFAITSRGCTGACTYCCIRAYARETSGSRLRLRSADAVADELAWLAHHWGVRVVFLQDDLFLLQARDRALVRIGDLGRAIADRGVHDMAFWIKARPETLDDVVVGALEDFGAIHVFLGVENHVPGRLSYLGRRHGPEDNDRAIALLREHGIGVSFNFMLFDPCSSLDDVAANVDFARRHLDLPWNLCRTELYSGTDLLAQVAASGRLTGDFRSYGYRIRDDRAEIAFRILRVALRDRAFDATSLHNRIIALAFAVQVHERFFPGDQTSDVARDAADLSIDTHRDTVDLLRRVIDFALTVSPDDTDGIKKFSVDLGMETNDGDLARRAKADRLFAALERRAGAGP
jgi:anaerobic magnesium-protoporphyrin IX monomethyl ester cyclase